MKYKIERRMGPKRDYRLIISGILLTIAVIIAGAPNVFTTAANANPLLIVAGGLICLAAALVDHLRSRLQAYSCAKAAIGYTQSALAPTAVNLGDRMQLMNLMNEKHKHGAAKWLARAGVFMIETFNALLKALAAVVALLLLFGHMLGLPDLHFIGLWIVLATITVIAFSKFSGAIVFFMSVAMGALQMAQAIQGAFTGMLGGPKVINIGGSEQKPLQEFVKNNRMVIITSTTLSVISWLGYAVAWWLFMGALGTTVPMGAVFLLYALATITALVPLVSHGLGLIELVGMVTIAVLGVPYATVLIAILLWEIAVMVVDSVMHSLFSRVKGLNKFI